MWLWLWLWLWVKISPTTKSEVVYYRLVERLYCGCGCGFGCGSGSKFRRRPILRSCVIGWWRGFIVVVVVVVVVVVALGPDSVSYTILRIAT